MQTIAGIDPSLTAAGIAILTHPNWTGTPNAPTLTTIGEPGRANTPAHTRARRIVRQTRRILNAIPDTCTLAVLEGPAYNTHNSWGSHETAGLWWGIAAGLTARHIPIAICPPTTRARFATGKGTADKTAVIDAMRHLWTTARIRDHNQADALALATAGAIHTGWWPAEHDHHHDTLDAIDWPDTTRLT